MYKAHPSGDHYIFPFDKNEIYAELSKKCGARGYENGVSPFCPWETQGTEDPLFMMALDLQNK